MTLQKPYAHNHILSAHLLFLHYTNVSVHPCVAPLWYFITLNTKQPIGKNGTHIFWTHRGVPGPDNLTTLHHHCFLSMTVRLSIRKGLHDGTSAVVSQRHIQSEPILKNLQNPSMCDVRSSWHQYSGGGCIPTYPLSGKPNGALVKCLEAKSWRWGSGSR